jgi:hypothetical protein
MEAAGLAGEIGVDVIHESAESKVIGSREEEVGMVGQELEGVEADGRAEIESAAEDS